MPGFWDRVLGVKMTDIPFVPVRPTYFPSEQKLTPIDEGDENWKYEGESKVFSGGLLRENGDFLATRESNAPIKQKIGSNFSEVTTISVNHIQVVIQRKPFKSNEIKQPFEDKRQIFAKWQHNGIYFLVVSVDIPLSETIEVIASMIT